MAKETDLARKSQLWSLPVSSSSPGIRLCYLPPPTLGWLSRWIKLFPWDLSLLSSPIPPSTRGWILRWIKLFPGIRLCYLPPSTLGWLSRWIKAEEPTHMCAQCCLPLCDPVVCSPPGSSVHEISRYEYWSGLPLPPPGALPDPGIETPSRLSCIGRQNLLPLSQPGRLKIA